MPPGLPHATRLAAGLGAPSREALALRWPAVDLEGERPRIRIEGTLQCVEEGFWAAAQDRAQPPPCPAAGESAAALRRTRSDQLERRLLAGPAWHG